MLVDLIQITTRDGVRLDGSLQRATAAPAWPVDAVCMIHGTGGNFYASTLFDALTERCLERGCAILRINTRGHDGISNAVTSKGGRRLGAAYESLDDCRHDVAGWVDWLKANVGPRVGLIGHSSGALKSLYALAHVPSLDVARVVAISPPRLSYSWFCSNPEGAEFLETYRQADELVQTGKPAALLDVGHPLSFVITAGGYVEKYGPDERYNFLKFIGSVRCPALITFGEIEADKFMAFRGAAGALAELKPGPCKVVTIVQADHFYSLARAELVACVDEWMGS